MWRNIVVTLLISSCSGTTIDSNDKDMQFMLAPSEIRYIVRRKFNNMQMYITEKPVTESNFLTFLSTINSGPEVCDRFSNAEDAFKSVRKQNPIECLRDKEYNVTRNMESLRDLLNVLAPSSNQTMKRTQPGSCVFVMFYTKSCISSKFVHMEFLNAAKFFPNIQWVLVDSFRFYSVNTDYGIIGLPTLMLFHEGKPVRKYNLVRPTSMSMINFLWVNTNLEPISSLDTVLYNLQDYYIKWEKPDPDPYLTIAWCFIFMSGLYYFVQTAVFNKFRVFIKRMWHESGIQHEHNE